jgi:hypothetical protein
LGLINIVILHTTGNPDLLIKSLFDCTTDKACDLLDGEKPQRKKLVTKGENCNNSTSKDFLQANSSIGSSFCVIGVPLNNPTRPSFKACNFSSLLDSQNDNEQSEKTNLLIANTNTEPKVEINRKKSTMRPAKKNNFDADGASIIESKVKVTFNLKGKQPILKYNNDIKYPSIKMGLGLDYLIKNLRKGDTMNVYKLMLDRSVFLKAYSILKYKSKSIARNSHLKTLNDINLKNIDSTIARLKNQSFQFRPISKVYLSKDSEKQ